ncbi:hypothetical protein [Plantactinospora endophytica]|uniref:Lipoprotein n=1 Tax=Plantactinospora endophytica TaxID=673535 RepID=A0ABQ4E2G1_9ACTN|nr:hypothetical protein [Plantactinospora endophytica]GIG88894.1 hypothetical protein Pen02_38300 [Plantactinospora endophytica]
MHRYLVRAALVALGGAVVLGSTGCGTSGTGGNRPATSAPAPGDAGLGSAPSDGASGQPEATGSPAGQGGQPGGGQTGSGGDNTGGGNTGGGSSGGGNTGGTKDKKPAGPTIVSYRIKQKPQCDQGTNVNRVPGLPVVLEWKVTGADKVTISVDGPGIYDTYPAVGTATINFPCGDGQPGAYVKHTYELRTVGGGEVRSKTLSASALVHEIPQV